MRGKFIFHAGLLIAGLFFMALGVALSIRSDLGTSPISCVPYVVSLYVPLTVGELTIFLHIILVSLQVLLLRKNFHLVQALQLIVGVIFGFFIDFSMYLTSWIPETAYAERLIMMILSAVITGFGVFLEVKAKIIYLAGEGLALAVSQVYNRAFGRAKVLVDSSMVAIGLALSILLLHGVKGIREGTVLAAVLVGTSAKFFNDALTPVWHKIRQKGKAA